jgi:hypothetical protein
MRGFLVYILRKTAVKGLCSFERLINHYINKIINFMVLVYFRFTEISPYRFYCQT